MKLLKRIAVNLAIASAMVFFMSVVAYAFWSGIAELYAWLSGKLSLDAIVLLTFLVLSIIISTICMTVQEYNEENYNPDRKPPIQ